MTEEELRDLIEDRFALDELMQQPGWQVIVRRVGSMRDKQRAHLLSGNATDMSRYRQIAGEITGMERVLNLKEQINDMIVAEHLRAGELA